MLRFPTIVDERDLDPGERLIVTRSNRLMLRAIVAACVAGVCGYIAFRFNLFFVQMIGFTTMVVAVAMWWFANITGTRALHRARNRVVRE